jgi:hypothetical protein
VCEYNHSDPEIGHCLVGALTLRGATAGEAEFVDRCSRADEAFCRSLSTSGLAPDRAREAANDLADALADYASALASGSASDSLALVDFFAHLVETPFTRAIVHWEEIGLDEDQLLRLIGVAREHRSFVIESDNAIGIEQVCAIPAGELASVDQVAAVSGIYREILLRTVDTVVDGYEILSDSQKAGLREIYSRETGHNAGGG